MPQPEILVAENQKQLSEYRKRTKRGELRELKGAYGEPVFIRKRVSDIPREIVPFVEGKRRKEAEELIERVKQRRIKRG